jgi:hypothetical protein
MWSSTRGCKNLLLTRQLVHPNSMPRVPAMKTLFGSVWLLVCVVASAHPGGLDANGGHYDRKTGSYHTHRAPANSTAIQQRSTATQPPAPSQAVVQQQTVPERVVPSSATIQSTAPSTSAVSEVEQLRRENEFLRKENQELRRLLGSRGAATPVTAPLADQQRVTSPAPASSSTPATQKWSLSSTGKRHNNTCRYFGSGRYCGPNEGVACKICGG